jgi:hypothetical protein
VPDLNHLWQRFLLASSLLIGLVIGAAATVFGYSNLTSVNIRWSVLHIDGVPLWTVAVVPLAIVLVAGTLYHWTDSFHHFTEHMRHRRRVHELEAEVASLRAHLDQVLEMPDQSTSKLPRRPITAEPLPAALETPVETPARALPEADLDTASPAAGIESANAGRKASRSKRAMLTVAAEPAEPAVATTNGGGAETSAAEPAPESTPEA